MKKKKVIIICVILLFSGLFAYNFKLNDKNNKNIKSNKVVKNINTEIDEKFKSKLYATVINDVINDYSYHDYKKNNKITYINYENNYNEKEEDLDDTIDDYDLKEDIENTIIDSELKISKSEDENTIDEKITINEEEINNNSDNVEEEINNNSDNVDEEEINNDSDNEEESSELYEEKNSDVLDEKIKEEATLKNGFYDEDGVTYYYENDNKVTGIKVIDGVNHYFSPTGKYLGTNNIKVIDVSYYQGDINWDEFVNGDYLGVILRIGYYSFPDKKFEEYIENVKRHNILYGIYLFSYAGDINGSNKEATFTNNMIDKYDLNPTLGIYYDIESWTSKNASSDNISKQLYDDIIENYINKVSNHVNNKYKVKVYSGRWYAMNRLGTSKKYVDWVAEYNDSCLYDDVYSMWQFTSKGIVPGINGYVDISYLLT